MLLIYFKSKKIEFLKSRIRINYFQNWIFVPFILKIWYLDTDPLVLKIRLRHNIYYISLLLRICIYVLDIRQESCPIRRLLVSQWCGNFSRRNEILELLSAENLGFWFFPSAVWLYQRCSFVETWSKYWSIFYVELKCTYILKQLIDFMFAVLYWI